MSVSMEGPAWWGVSETEGLMVCPGTGGGAALARVHATMLLTCVVLGLMGERCVCLLGPDSGKGNPILLAAPQTGRVAPGF